MDVTDMLHVLSHRAYKVIFLGIVIQVLWKKGVIAVFTLILCMEHIVFHVWYDSFFKQMRIVLLASISRVRAYLFTLYSEPIFERVDERCECCLVVSTAEDAIVGDELLFG